MRKLLLFQFKQMFRNKKTPILFLLLPLLLSILPFLVETSASDKTKIYSSAIIDKDHSKLSEQLIHDMQSYAQLRVDRYEKEDTALLGLHRGKYDVVYVIQEGFEQEIFNARMNHLLTAHAKVNTPSVKWVNDQISLRVMRMWSSQDLLKKIREIRPDYTEEDYAKAYAKRKISDTLLTLEVHSFDQDTPLFPTEYSIGTKVFLHLWLYILLLLSMGSVRKIVEERQQGLIERLEFSGISTYTYHLSSAILFLLSTLLPFILSLIASALFSSEIAASFLTLNSFSFISCCALFLLVALLCRLIFLILATYAKTASAYMMAAQWTAILMLLIGTLWLN